MAFQGATKVWKDGRIIPWADATLHVSSHGLNYGTGVFEGIRCYATDHGPAIFRLDAHVERFFRSAGVYEMDLPYTRAEITDACREVVRANGLGDCYIRPIAYLGSGSLSVFAKDCPVEVAIFAWAWGAYLGAGLHGGSKVLLSKWRKFDSGMMPTWAKACGQYINSALAVREALKQGCDEAILLDQHGNLAEGSGENLFLVKQDKIITNGEDAAILPGITLASVLEIAQDLGLATEVRTMRPEEIFESEEVFFTGTAAEVTPVTELDHKPLSGGQPGAVTLRLQKVFLEAVRGKNAKYAGWLTAV